MNIRQKKVADTHEYKKKLGKRKGEKSRSQKVKIKIRKKTVVAAWCLCNLK